MIKILTKFKKQVDAFSKPYSLPSKGKLRGLAFSFWVLMGISFVGVSGVQAQNEVTVTGVVMDASNSETLPGVNILLKGSGIGTITDIDGSYSLSVPSSEATLVYSFIGFLNQEIKVGNQTTIDVRMASSATDLNEVVVVGYGTQKKSDLTGAVTRVNASTFKNQPLTQVSDMLAGTVAGFYGNQGTSASGGSSLEVRGPTSLTGGTSPLIVVDGVIFYGSLSDINPNDIESIDILKDASSAAVFGSKAASGVVMITTIKGESGATTINF